MVWRLLLRLPNKLNAFVGVAHKTSEQPKQHADRQDDYFLSSSEVPKKDIDKRDHATSYAHIEPPQDPMVNPKMKIHITLLTLPIRRFGDDQFFEKPARCSPPACEDLRAKLLALASAISQQP
jgi:hypothetical protein